MLLLWQLSLFVSILALMLSIVKRSWVFIIISTFTFIPIAYYFSWFDSNNTTCSNDINLVHKQEKIEVN